ncbi:MAG: ferritin-like domain-containing protein [Chloroflexota bacterium]|nr:ferritin-like domain-containing protein [Chloroflexota bacterium]
MNNEERAYEEGKLRACLSGSISRAQLLRGAGIGLAAAAIPGAALASATPVGSTTPVSTLPTGGTLPQSFNFFPAVTSGTYTTENIGDIFNIASTAEVFAVTLLTAAVNNATTIGLKGLILQTVQAALAEEQDHLDFLLTLGATPLTMTFTVPDPKILTDYTTFFSTLEGIEDLFIAAYMTATREFAELGQPTLAKFAYQIGGTEAEHRVVVRAALALNGNDHTPPNNKGFETDLLLYVRDAATILTQLGFIGGKGTAAAYPGRTAALAAAGPMTAGVIQNTPNNATSTVTVTGPGDLTGERK